MGAYAATDGRHSDSSWNHIVDAFSPLVLELPPFGYVIDNCRKLT